MKHNARLLCAVLALLLVFSLAMAEEGFDPNAMDEALLMSEEGALGIVGFSEEEALAEEGALEAFESEPGDYEWYILPTAPIDGASYVDIFPGDVVRNADGSWSYSFTLQEAAGVSYQPYVLSIVSFIDQKELRRESFDLDKLTEWWRDNAKLCNCSVVYQGTVAEQDINAVAISIIGIDEYGNEQEFHSLIDVRMTNP